MTLGFILLIGKFACRQGAKVTKISG